MNRTWYRGDSDFGSLSKHSFWLPINISDFDEVKGLSALNKSLAGRICTARTWWSQTSEKDLMENNFSTAWHGLQLVPHLWKVLGHFNNYELNPVDGYEGERGRERERAPEFCLASPPSPGRGHSVGCGWFDHSPQLSMTVSHVHPFAPIAATYLLKHHRPPWV